MFSAEKFHGAIVPSYPGISSSISSDNSLSLEGEIYPPLAAPIRRIPDSFGKASRRWGEGVRVSIDTPSRQGRGEGLSDSLQGEIFRNWVLA